MKNSSTFGNQVPFVVWTLLWLLAPVVTIVLFAKDTLDPPTTFMFGRDFTNLWVAGKLVLSGQAVCTFDVECFRSAMEHQLGLIAKQNYSYPPHALFIAIPLAFVSYYWALAIWTIAGVVFFAFCARPYLPKGFPTILASFTTAGWLNIWAGHYGFLLGGLWLLFFHQLGKRPRVAGVFAGLLTFKPHLGLMIAATAIPRRKVFIAALVTTAVAVALSALAFEPVNWVRFLVDTSAMQRGILTSSLDEGYFRLMPSAYVAFGRGAFGAVMQVAFAAAAIWLLWRHRTWDVFSAATATFVLIPYAFNYDMAVVCLGIALIIFSRWQSLSNVQRGGLLVGFLSPQLTLYAPPIVPISLLYVLHLQLRHPLTAISFGTLLPVKAREAMHEQAS